MSDIANIQISKAILQQMAADEILSQQQDYKRLVYVAKYVSEIEWFALSETTQIIGVTMWPIGRHTKWEGSGRDCITAFRFACDEIIAFEQNAVTQNLNQ